MSGDEHIAFLHVRHQRRVLHDVYRPDADLVADGSTAGEQLALALHAVAFPAARFPARAHGFRPRLQDMDAAIQAVLAPLDVHRTAVMRFDQAGGAREFEYIRVRERKTVALCRRHVFRADRLACRGVFGEGHFLQLRTQAPAQDRRLARSEHRLVDVELVRIDRPLHHQFAQPPGRSDEDDVAEARFRIEGEHHAARAPVAAHHALYRSRDGDRAVLETLVGPVGDGAIVVQGGKDVPDRRHDLVGAADIEKGLLLACKGSIGEILRGG